MKVSIIIPVYNAEKYIPRCAEALSSQTYSDIEIIFVNDGSTDQSLELCVKCAEGRENIKIISKERSEGAGPARNSGIDASSGEYIMFLDADDIPKPEMVERLVSAVTESKCDAAVCGYETFIEETGDVDTEVFRPERKILDTPQKTREFFIKYFPEGIAGYLWNKIYRASVIKENGLRFPDMRRLQDGVFNVHFFQAAGSCCLIDDVLYRYRVNAQTDMFRKCPRDYFELIKRFSQSYLEVKKDWGDYPDTKINNFFLNELGTCIENTVSPQWDMDRQERKAYILRISEDELLKAVYESGDYNIGRYRKLLIKLLLRKKCAAAVAAVRFKTGIKITFGRFFYFVKRIGKNG